MVNHSNRIQLNLLCTGIGMHYFVGSPKSSYVSLSVSGVMMLAKGDAVSVYINVPNDPDVWYIQDESGFSCVLLAPSV